MYIAIRLLGEFVSSLFPFFFSFFFFSEEIIPAALGSPRVGPPTRLNGVIRQRQLLPTTRGTTALRVRSSAQDNQVVPRNGFNFSAHTAAKNASVVVAR